MKNENNGMEIKNEIREKAKEILMSDMSQKEKDKEMVKLRKSFVKSKIDTSEITYSAIEDLILDARVKYIKLSSEARFISIIFDILYVFILPLTFLIFMIPLWVRNVVLRLWIGIKKILFFPFKIIAGLGLNK